MIGLSFDTVIAASTDNSKSGYNDPLKSTS